jgi:acyl-CoA synthetase (AMP-forming)/AMP-acid ligase II
MIDESWLPDPCLTFPARFAQRVAAAPQEIAIFEVVIEAAGPRTVPHTVGSIDRRAQVARRRLRSVGVGESDRVALCVADPADFLAFFIAAEVLGAVPVPMPSASDFRLQDAFAKRIRGVIEDCSPMAVVTDCRLDLRGMSDDENARPSVLQTDGGGLVLATDPVAGSVTFQRSPEDTAFIQYTSGSTGTPKGVMVTHRNLVANIRASAMGAGLGPADRSVSWLPLYHDMGLVGGLLLGVYLGIATFLMRTKMFMGRPDSWLRVISEYNGTFSCAPNFAYHLVSHRLPERVLAGLDLSSWRLAFNGAEPIDNATIHAFTKRFAAAGVKATTMFPVYGLAECTLAASFSTPGGLPCVDYVDRERLWSHGRAESCAPTSPSAVPIVSVGQALPGHRVRIVNQSGSADVSERTLGEVVVSGPSVTPYDFQKDGRYGQARTELRTGDIGYMTDGKLCVVDRLKDVLIIGGRNIVPSEVEGVVATVSGVRFGSVVAFAQRVSHGTDSLYLVVGAEPGARRDELQRNVRKLVYDQLGLTAADVVIVKPSAVPKTSSGKVRRATCRELYERGAFEIGRL